MGDAMLRCEPLFFESRVGVPQPLRDRRRSVLPIPERFDELSYACLPLVVHGRAVGGVSLVFSARAHLRRRRAHVPHRARAPRGAGAGAREPLRAREGGPGAAGAPEAADRGALVGGDARGGRPTGDAGRHRGARARGRGRRGRPTSTAISACSAPMERASPSSSRSGTSSRRLRPARGAGRPRATRRLPRERGGHRCPSPPALPDAMGRGEAFRAYGVLPLVREDRVLGVLAFSADQPRRFSPAGARVHVERRRALRGRPRAGAPLRRCPPHGAPPAERARTAARRHLRLAPAGQHARLRQRRGRPHLADRCLPDPSGRTAAGC